MKFFKIFYDSLEVLDVITDEQCGKLFKKMRAYNCGEIYESGDKMVDVLFIQFKNQFDRDTESYIEKCEKNKENARIRWDKENANACERIKEDANDAKKKTKTKTKKKKEDKDKDKDKELLPTEEAPPLEKKVVYGDPDVNECLEIIKGFNDGICDGKQTEQRRYGKILLNKIKKVSHVSSGKYTWQEYMQGLLGSISGNKYHSHKISGPRIIYDNLSSLQQVAKQTATEVARKTRKRTFL